MATSNLSKQNPIKSSKKGLLNTALKRYNIISMKRLVSFDFHSNQIAQVEETLLARFKILISDLQSFGGG